MALPCQNTCPHYCEGCHKTCAQWAQYRVTVAEQSRQIKAYLRASREETRAIIAQCYYPQPYRR